MVIHRSNFQKDHPCTETRRLSHKAWKSVQWFDLGVGIEKKGKDRTGQDSQKKSQGGNISPIWGEAPTVPIEMKNCVAGKLVNVTCAKFQDDILRGYYGVEFPIFLFWFLFGPYNSEALLRCLWYWEMFCVNSMAGFKYAMRIFQLSKQSCYDN